MTRAEITSSGQIYLLGPTFGHYGLGVKCLTTDGEIEHLTVYLPDTSQSSFDETLSAMVDNLASTVGLEKISKLLPIVVTTTAKLWKPAQEPSHV